MRTTMVTLFVLCTLVVHANIGVGYSGAFSLDTAAPGFDWQTPEDGETWLTNQPVTLLWTTTLSLKWSEDNGGECG